MFLGRGSVVFSLLLCAYVFVTFIQVSEGRPRARHRRGGAHCGRCGPGWGVIGRCARGRDTECAKCPRGTYSPHHSSQPCWICSRCGPGLYEARPCTATTDTLCDSCHRAAPLDNTDYRRKCEASKNFFLAPEDAENTGEESVLVNEPDDRLDMENKEKILAQDAEADSSSDKNTDLEVTTSSELKKSPGKPETKIEKKSELKKSKRSIPNSDVQFGSKISSRELKNFRKSRIWIKDMPR